MKASQIVESKNEDQKVEDEKIQKGSDCPRHHTYVLYMY